MADDRVAVVGGTGKEGSGISMRLAKAGYTVIVGSREKEKAERKAREYSEKTGKNVAGMENAAAVREARIVILTVPSTSHKSMLVQLKEELLTGEKIFVDTTIFLDHENFPKLKLPEEGSAALQTQKILGGDFPVVCAFQNISSVSLNHLDKTIGSDVLVCANNAEAKKKIMDMISTLHMRPVDCGDLSQCATIEALTSLLLTVCRIHKVKDAGIKITGIEGRESGDRE